jgi:hypothetical protein
MSAKSGIEVVIQQEMKCHISIIQSTTTHVTSSPSDHGHPVVKSVKILVHGFEETVRDLRIPEEHC